MFNIKGFGVMAILAVLAAGPARAQTPAGQTNPLIESLRDGAGYVRDMFTKAADQMSEEDYTFRPTPEVRSLGQLLAHVADSNYFFCSAAKGERSPVRDVEKTRTSRDDIRRTLAESFDYCDEVYSTVRPDAKATIEFMGRQRSPVAVLNFRNYHSLLHYGNVVTYMRLRGKVPPSSQLTQGI